MRRPGRAMPAYIAGIEFARRIARILLRLKIDCELMKDCSYWSKYGSDGFIK